MAKVVSSSIKPPAVLVPTTHVPVNGERRKVTARDSWVSLAAERGMAPWDLIRYNYPSLPANLQEAAKEVNWYLENYVGCTTVTGDGRNYKFSGTERSGMVWLPKAAVAVAPVSPPTPDELAKQAVLNTLKEPLVSTLTVGVGWKIVSGFEFLNIARAIEGGHIIVKADTTLTGSAEYNWGSNVIRVPAGWGNTPNLGNRALIIHECMHAIFDYRKMTTKVEEAEGFAYLVQALYGQVNGANGRHIVSADPLDPVSWISWQLIFDESRRLAVTLARTHWVSEDDASTLYTAIKGANFYRARVGRVEVNDGLAAGAYGP